LGGGRTGNEKYIRLFDEYGCREFLVVRLI